MAKWKSTAKVLPPEGSTVLAWWGPAAHNSYGVVTYAHPGLWHDPDDDEDDYRAPDYWMGLPPGPIGDAASEREGGKDG